MLLAAAVAPMAPDPFVPDPFAPVRLTTVIDDATLCDKVATTLTLLKGVSANALHTSAVPSSWLLRFTKAQVRPPPRILCTIVLGDPLPSLATKAKSSSLL